MDEEIITFHRLIIQTKFKNLGLKLKQRQVQIIDLSLPERYFVVLLSLHLLILFTPLTFERVWYSL